VLLASISSAQVTFDSSFESGNGTDFTEATPGNYTFRIEADTNSTDRQWFYFAVENANGQTLNFSMLDISSTNVPSHWNNAVPVFSTDGGMTFQFMSTTPSSDGTTYDFSHTFTTDTERIAFHYPYTFSQIEPEVLAYALHPDVTHEVLGQSAQGRDIHYLRITNDSSSNTNKLAFWIVSRQHSAEVTSSFTMDGFLQFITSGDSRAQILRDNAIVHIAPCASPDGVVLGNYRDNAQGVNLNRVWDGSASVSNGPEVLLIQNKMAQTIADSDGDYVYFADLHSTSGANPHFAFHAGPSQMPALYPTPATYHDDSRAYLALVRDYAPHFNATQGSSSSTNTGLAYHSERINRGVLAFTFEGAYIRQYSGPNPGDFMSPALHRQVGEAMGQALIDYYNLGEGAGFTNSAWKAY
jgi:murein tripeptide amidase MpaA